MADVGTGEGSRKPAATRRGRGRGSGPRSQRPKSGGAHIEGEGGGEEGSPSRAGGGDRRPLRFWQPFNDWWRADLERLGRRPNAQEIMAWFNENAQTIWKDEIPSLQETRVHAKCLRSLPLVRDYFRNYRAKKRAISNDDDYDGEEGDMRGGDNNMLNADDVSARFAALQQHAFQQAAYRLDYGGAGAAGVAEFLQSGLHPGLQAHALWGAHTASLDPQQQELLRNLTLTQLQHANAVQQHLTLAAFANQLAARHSVMQSVTSPSDLGVDPQQQVVPPPLPLQLHEAQTLPSLPLLNLQQTLPLQLTPSLMLTALTHQPSVEVSSTGGGAGGAAGGTEGGTAQDDGRNLLSLMLTTNEEAPKHVEAGTSSVSAPADGALPAGGEAAIGECAAAAAAAVSQSANVSAAAALPVQSVVGVPAAAATSLAAWPPAALLPGGEVAADRDDSSSLQPSQDPVASGQAPERGTLLERPHDELVQQVLELERKLQAQAEANVARDAELAAAQLALREAQLRLVTKTEEQTQQVDEQQVLSALTELGQQPVVGTGANRQVGHLLVSTGVAKKTSSVTDSLSRKRHQPSAPSGSGTSAPEPMAE